MERLEVKTQGIFDAIELMNVLASFIEKPNFEVGHNSLIFECSVDILEEIALALGPEFRVKKLCEPEF